MSVLLVMYVLSGLFLAALSVPLMKLRVPPNGLYGFRIRRTMEDASTWYRVNACAGKYLLLTGLAIALAAIVFYRVPGLTLDTYALSCLAVVAVMVTITIVQSVRLLRTIREN